jgi:hypothetical protein
MRSDLSALREKPQTHPAIRRDWLYGFGSGLRSPTHGKTDDAELLDGGAR